MIFFSRNAIIKVYEMLRNKIQKTEETKLDMRMNATCIRLRNTCTCPALLTMTIIIYIGAPAN